MTALNRSMSAPRFRIRSTSRSKRVVGLGVRGVGGGGGTGTPPGCLGFRLAMGQMPSFSNISVLPAIIHTMKRRSLKSQRAQTGAPHSGQIPETFPRSE